MSRHVFARDHAKSLIMKQGGDAFSLIMADLDGRYAALCQQSRDHGRDTPIIVQPVGTGKEGA